MTKKTPFPLCSFTLRRRGRDLVSDSIEYLTGIHVQNLTAQFSDIWSMPGWCADLYTIYHRARYGWAPRDVWNLDFYLDNVLGETLVHLADTTHSAPHGYPFPHGRGPVDDDGIEMTNHAQWRDDLRRWSAVFLHQSNDMQWTLQQHHAAKRAQALQELLPWWEALWD